MGIKGLHKALSFCTVKDNLRNYRNAIIAVDTSSWMHKSVYSISEKFVETTDSGHLDEGCIHVSARYIITRCKELIECFGIRAVYLVLDGKRIPLKADESKDRDEKRQQNLSEARRLKRCGQRSKAEDKYKTCIRIKDGFTASVVRKVKRELSHYGRVHFVNSPHEADSQLTRLVLDGVADAVITEDSDVLVYSAAAHKAFPILFKLDRKTGNCDCIKMDWLLSLTSEEAAKPCTSTNTLEVMFRRLAARQAKRKGFGVRLFVQACILAGCDYRKSLEGVGTTNAFKMVRDNAFRNDSVRFRKILESLPKKVKQKIDIDEYEEILAKSEAIFFYHPVLHTDGKVKPLLNPRISPDETGDEHHYTDHYPFMSRFQGDWSFLGIDSAEPNDNTEQSPANEIPNNQLLSEGPTKISKGAPWIQTKKRDSLQIMPSGSSRILQNPYKKSKPSSSNKTYPLKEININSRISPDKKQVAKWEPKSQKGTGAITKYLVKPDVRCARTSYSSITATERANKKRPLSAAGSSFRISVASKKSAAQSFFLPRSSKKEKRSTSVSDWPDYDPKQYETTEETKFSYTPTNSLRSTGCMPTDKTRSESTPFKNEGEEFKDSKLYDFYDLTNSNSCHSDNVHGEVMTEALKSKDAAKEDKTIRTVHAETETTDPTNAEGIACEHLETPFNANKSQEIEEEGMMTSKYFQRKTRSRRVTLDSVTSPLSSEKRSNESETSKLQKSSGGETLIDSERGKPGKRHPPNTWMVNFLSRRKRVSANIKKS